MVDLSLQNVRHWAKFQGHNREQNKSSPRQSSVGVEEGDGDADK